MGVGYGAGVPTVAQQEPFRGAAEELAHDVSAQLASLLHDPHCPVVVVPDDSSHPRMQARALRLGLDERDVASALRADHVACRAQPWSSQLSAGWTASPPRLEDHEVQEQHEQRRQRDARGGPHT
jgi:hypothetical protein